jgi:hypothetical protein
MTRPLSFSAAVGAWGAVRLGLPQIAPLRKKIPAWAPQGTAGHFLKYADEQTVAAVAAVDRAIESFGADFALKQNWPIIAAPRFLGRVAGPAVIHGYDTGGPQSVSPHIIPQNSLHSVSGALSILLASRGPNFGIGGGPESLDDALLATFSLPSRDVLGCWLVATAWDPEPVADRNCRFLNEPVCHAFAMTLQFAGTSSSQGELRLRTGVARRGPSGSQRGAASVPDIVSQLEQAESTGEFRLAWPLSWGAEAELNVRIAERQQRLAA